MQRQTLAQQLRRSVEDSGKSLYQLAKDSGVSRPQLWRFMQGERDLSLPVFDRVCAALGLRLCREEEHGPGRPKREKKKGD